MKIAVVIANHEEMISSLREELPVDVELIGVSSPEELADPSDIDGTIGYWFPTEEEAPKVRWIHCPNAGFDDIPAYVRGSSQWRFTHGGGPGAVPIAEWTLASMLFFAHRFRKILQHEADRSWYKDRMSEMAGTPLRGATAGIVGYGAIGREVARLCKSFGMNVHASLGANGKVQRPTYRTEGTGDPEGVLPDRWFEMDELFDVLPEWDYVILYLRVTDRTRQLINSDTLKHMKRSAILINAARGTLVDEGALVEALREGVIGGAALDVFETEPLPKDHPLRDAPNILISPHCSPESDYYRSEMYTFLRSNIRRFADRQPLLNVVN